MKLADLAAYAERKYHIKEEHNWPTRPGISGLRSPATGRWIAFLIREWDDARGREVERCDMKCGRQVLTTRHAGYLTFPFLMRGGNDWLGIRFEADTEPDVVEHLFDWAVLPESQQRVTVVIDPPGARSTEVVEDERPLIPSGMAGTVFSGASIPQKIQEMIHLYHYGSSSFRSKCENFVRQGKFMEDYEDDQPWNGYFQKYFPTYHDMNFRQLRGYFTWRTELRKGHWQSIPTSMAYVYLYELLNGIGTKSPEESLAKMTEFEENFLEAGWGDALMRMNLQRWEMEFAILHGIPAVEIRKYAAPDFLKDDDRLTRLMAPEGVSDDDLLEALTAYAAPKTAASPVFTTEKGRHLFAAACREGIAGEEHLFADCFGKPVTIDWYPLSNAVSLNGRPAEEDYVLDPVRSFHYEDGKWKTTCYQRVLFKKDHFQGFLHETDRALRKYLKTKHYLRAKADEAWAAPYVQAAIRKEEAAEEEAKRPKVHIDFSSLGRIRSDAIDTAESLLTEEEKAEAAAASAEPTPKPQPVPVPEPAAPEKETAGADEGPLGPLQKEILAKLLKGDPVDSLLKQHFLMPSIVADEINEALFDKIGDTVLTCDEDKLGIVEDYRDDIEDIVKN